MLRTLAAIADAHDEAFLVTRTADTDGFQPTDLKHAIEQLLDILSINFLGGYFTDLLTDWLHFMSFQPS